MVAVLVSFGAFPLLCLLVHMPVRLRIRCLACPRLVGPRSASLRLEVQPPAHLEVCLLAAVQVVACGCAVKSALLIDVHIPNYYISFP